ncbi:Peroxidase precursor, putative, partial [Gryllus bimaculatus]
FGDVFKGSPLNVLGSFGQQQCPQVPGPCNNGKYRTFDGSCNNLHNPTWGMAMTTYNRVKPAKYADGIQVPPTSVTGKQLPPSRLVSHVLFPDAEINDPKWTLAAMQWGQIITHDMSMAAGTTQAKAHATRCCTADGSVAIPKQYAAPSCFPIILGPHDPVYSKVGQQCMNFVRTTTDISSGCAKNFKPAEQLREGRKGRLITEIRHGKIYPPSAPNKTAACDHMAEDEPCYLAGWENTRRHGLTYGTHGYTNDYDPHVDPSVLNGHATAAFRYFHSAIQGFLKLVGEHRESYEALRLSDHFNRPEVIEQGDNMDKLIRGLATQPQQAVDQYFTSEITKFLFRNGRPFGQDLRAIDIQRGRDHGLASYNDYRHFCGLPKARSFEDFGDYISRENVAKLAKLYAHPDDVDFTVGGSLEAHVEGTLSGPTFLCVLVEQFYRTRVGDRYFYENGEKHHSFSLEQLNEIRKASISRLFCDNGDEIYSMQPKGFKKLSPGNQIVPCHDYDSIPVVNLELWRDSHTHHFDYKK